MAKLGLFLFDPDKTYDVLFYDKILSAIVIKLSSYFGFHGFISSARGIAVVDRFTPDGIPWADQWTEQVFNWLKLYTKTWVIGEDELNGRAYGFTPPFDSSSIGNITLPNVPDSLSVKVKKGQEVKFSWLELAHGYSDRWQYVCDGKVNDSFVEFTKKTRWVRTPEDTTIQFNTSEWLFNSLVIDGNVEFVGSIESVNGLLYEKLGERLNQITSQLKIPSNIQVLTGYTATLRTIFAIFEGARRSSMTYISWTNPDVICPNVQLDFVDYSQPVFQDVPDSYYYCGLVKGDNNKWNKQVEDLSDKGRNPSITYDKDSDTFFCDLKLALDMFKLWRGNYLYPNELDYASGIVGYDDWNDGAGVKIFSLYNPSPMMGEWADIEFFTATGNKNPQNVWVPAFASWSGESYIQTSHPVLDTHSTNWLDKRYKTSDWWGRPYWHQPLQSLKINTSGAKKCYLFRLRPDVKRGITTGFRPPDGAADFPGSMTYNYYSFDEPPLAYRSTDRPQYCHFTITNYIAAPTGGDNGYGGKFVRVDAYEKRNYFRFNSVAIECLGCSDYNLFSHGEVALLRNSIDVFIEGHRHSIETYHPGGGSEGHGTTYHENHRVEKAVKHGVKFLVNAIDPQNIEIIPTFLPAS